MKAISFQQYHMNKTSLEEKKCSPFGLHFQYAKTMCDKISRLLQS